MARLRDFKGIEGTDFYADDRGLQRLLRELVAPGEYEEIDRSLHACARLVAGRWNELAAEGARNEQLPRLIKEDRVGNPVERVEWSSPVRQLRREVAEMGILEGARSELHRFAMVYLVGHNGEAGLTCGISCTDGLLRVLRARGSEALRDDYLARIGSSQTPFAGAQFITEQAGGSDIGAIEAVAVPAGEGTWEISGEKWYCSNPDEFFLVAARPQGAPAGTAGVAIFLVPRVLPDGSVNRLRYRRLKDKLGTRSLPTAEIDFDRATAFCIGEPKDGFKNLMLYVINTSRMHNAANALGFMHRAFLEARNYARQRDAFGGPIIGYPLVQEQLLALLAALWRERVVFFRLVALCDRHGAVPAEREQQLWQRCLVNLAKYRTAVGLTAYIRDAILLFGANGVIEDFSILPRLLRDALIIETWEGTHNTLALQVVRDLTRFDFLGRWQGEVSEVLERWPAGFLAATRARLAARTAQLAELLPARGADPQWGLAHARRIVDGLAGTLGVAWLADLALHDRAVDATPAYLTAIAADQLWGSDEERLTRNWTARIAKCAPALIDEVPVHPGGESVEDL